MKFLKHTLAITALFAFLASCMGCKKEGDKGSRVDHLPYYNEASFTPIWMEPKDEAVARLHQIAPFELTNQDGDVVNGQTFMNKIYVSDFFFTTCPGICPTMTKNMALLQEEFLEDEEVMLVSHSVTPEKDSVAVLKKYATNHGVDSKTWHLVTGTRKEIYTLGRTQYFVEEDQGLVKTEDEFLHTENFVLVDKNRHIRGIYNGLNRTDIQQLIADIKVLKQEG